MDAIKTDSLSKHYRFGVRGVAVRALEGLSFSVREGEIFGLLGANGAGKSTAIKILLGLVKPNSGSFEIFSEKLSSGLKKSIGYLPETPNFYKFLTGLELVSFYARLCGMGNAAAKKAALEALETVGLADAANRRLAVYSKGMQQRAGLAQAIVHNPKLLILDEPASGLDPVGMADMAETILKLKESGKTILLSSHLLGEVEKLCDRVGILSKGSLVSMGSLDELLTLSDEMRLELRNVDARRAGEIVEFSKGLGAEVVSLSQGKISLGEYFKRIVGRGK